MSSVIVCNAYNDGIHFLTNNVDDDDLGSAADVFDGFSNEAAFDLDLDIDFKLEKDGYDAIRSLLDGDKAESYPPLHSNNSNEKDEDKRVFSKYKILPQIPPPNSGNANRKVTSLKKHQARDWRRKRILNGTVSSGKPVSEKHRTLHIPSMKKPDNILKDPLLGGEKIKANREPVPMKLRALPQSFWNEPNSINDTTLAGSSDTVLPPLFCGEANSKTSCQEEDIDVHPPQEKTNISPRYSPSNKKKWVMTSPPNGDLIDRLFDHLETKRFDESMIVRRGRPRKKEALKIPPPPQRDDNDDPCIVEALATKLFPDLSLDHKPGQRKAPTNFSVIRIGKGVEFPAIQIAKNYPAILNELVLHL